MALPSRQRRIPALLHRDEGEQAMQARQWMSRAGAFALVTLFSGCATWHDMDRQEKGTAVGATGGAVAGAVVGGPIGAAVGAGIGGYAGHHQGFGRDGNNARVGDGDRVSRPGAGAYDAGLVRSVQSSLNQRGYDAGAVDGEFGPSTQNALRQFQRSNGLADSGSLDESTLRALGISR
jgi:hypothetical protein